VLPINPVCTARQHNKRLQRTKARRRTTARKSAE
jgi:hypothetical protein